MNQWQWYVEFETEFEGGLYCHRFGTEQFRTSPSDDPPHRVFRPLLQRNSIQVVETVAFENQVPTLSAPDLSSLVLENRRDREHPSGALSFLGRHRAGGRRLRLYRARTGTPYSSWKLVATGPVHRVLPQGNEVVISFHDQQRRLDFDAQSKLFQGMPRGLDFDGTAEINLTDPLGGEILGLHAWTLEFWVKLPFGIQSQPRLFRAFEASPAADFRIYCGGPGPGGAGDGGVTLWWDADANEIATSGINLCDEAPHHVAIVRETEQRHAIVIDGKLVMRAEFPAGLGVQNSGDLFAVGASGADAFVGTVWDVRAWRYARTVAEIESDRFTPLDGSEVGLIDTWPMNEGVDVDLGLATGTIDDYEPANRTDGAVFSLASGNHFTYSVGNPQEYRTTSLGELDIAGEKQPMYIGRNRGTEPVLVNSLEQEQMLAGHSLRRIRKLTEGGAYLRTTPFLQIVNNAAVIANSSTPPPWVALDESSGDEITLEFLLRIDQAISARSGILGAFGAGANNRNGLELSVDADGFLELQTSSCVIGVSETVRDGFTSDHAVIQGQIFQASIVFKPGTEGELSLYLDGLLAGTVTPQDATGEIYSLLTIDFGANNLDAPNGTDLSLFFVRLWDRALTANEIRDNLWAPSLYEEVDEDGLLGSWPCEEIVANTGGLAGSGVQNLGVTNAPLTTDPSHSTQPEDVELRDTIEQTTVAFKREPSNPIRADIEGWQPFGDAIVSGYTQQSHRLQVVDAGKIAAMRPTGDHTLECWFRLGRLLPSQMSGTPRVWLHDTNGVIGESEWRLDDNSIEHRMRTDTSFDFNTFQLPSTFNRGTGLWDLNRWHHGAIVWRDGGLGGVSTVDVYVDGHFLGNDTVDGTIEANATVGTWRIMQAWDGGAMQQWRYWKRALSQAEIRANMRTRLRGNEPGLAQCCELNALRGGNTFHDITTNEYDFVYSSGASDTIRIGGGIYPSTPAEIALWSASAGRTPYKFDRGQFGHVVFNRTGSSVVRFDDVPNSTRDLSIAFWMRWDGNLGENHNVLGTWVESGVTHGEFRARINTAGNIIVARDTTNTTEVTSATGGLTLTPGEWTHVAATFGQESGLARLYVNGAMIDERPWTEADAAGWRAYTSDFTLGQRSDSTSNPYRGAIGSFEWWVTERTPEQIRAHLDREAPADVEVMNLSVRANEMNGDQVGDFSLNRSVGNMGANASWPTREELEVFAVDLRPALERGLSDEELDHNALDESGSFDRFAMEVPYAHGIVATERRLSDVIDSALFPWGFWGWTNAGALRVGSFSGVDIAPAMRLDSDGARIEVATYAGLDYTSSDELRVSLWLYRTAVNNQSGADVVFARDTWFSIGVLPDGQLEIFFNPDAGGSPSALTTPFDRGRIIPGRWFHVELIGDGSATDFMRLKLNGQELPRASGTASTPATVANPAIVGAASNGFLGYVREPRIWVNSRSENFRRAELVGNEEGLAYYLRLNELSGDALQYAVAGGNGSVLGDVTREVFEAPPLRIAARDREFTRYQYRGLRTEGVTVPSCTESVNWAQNVSPQRLGDLLPIVARNPQLVRELERPSLAQRGDRGEACEEHLLAAPGEPADTAIQERAGARAAAALLVGMYSKERQSFTFEGDLGDSEHVKAGDRISVVDDHPEAREFDLDDARATGIVVKSQIRAAEDQQTLTILD